MTPSLAGLKIAVTRPREQAVQLARSIERDGGIPLLFPLLGIAPVEDAKTLHEQISRLDQFDLAIFISPNAVRYGVEAIRAAGAPTDGGEGECVGRAAARHVGLKPDLRIATVGKGSAKALRELGISDILAPTERFDSEGLLALPELQNVQGWHVMIFRGNGGRELLGDTLKARGATVEYAECYRRSKPQWDAGALLGAAPDAITVTSSEALSYLWQILDDAQRENLRGLPLFVPHQRIAELARQQGWRDVRLTPPGDVGLISVLMKWGSERQHL